MPREKPLNKSIPSADFIKYSTSKPNNVDTPINAANINASVKAEICFSLRVKSRRFLPIKSTKYKRDFTNGMGKVERISTECFFQLRAPNALCKCASCSSVNVLATFSGMRSSRLFSAGSVTVLEVLLSTLVPVCCSMLLLSHCFGAISCNKSALIAF